MPVQAKRIFRVNAMIPATKCADVQPFLCLSAGCRGFIHAKPALARALGGKATAQPGLHAGGYPEAWPHHARFFPPSFQSLGGPAAIPG